MNYIIGSGLIGMLAKHILGDNWKFVSQKRSRYYSAEPVLADNFIAQDKGVDDVVYDIYPFAKNRGMIYFKRAFSIAGELTYNEGVMTSGPYVRKVYGDDAPELAPNLLPTGFFVYNLEAKIIHDTLQERMLGEIGRSPSLVKHIDINEKTITIENKIGGLEKLDYDKLVITAPLNVFYDWMRRPHNLQSKSICFYYMESDKVDLEDANQALVCDGVIDFFKVVSLGKNKYLFWTFDTIENPLEYFGAFIGYSLDILGSYRIEEAMPIGEPPSMRDLEEKGIICVGSNAQWDDFMDISASIKRLLKIKSE